MKRPEVPKKITFFLSDTQYRWMDWNNDWFSRKFGSKWEDRMYRWQEEYIQYGLSKMICKIWGHQPVPDHCGMPKHDHCMGCGIRMPGQAPRG